VERDDLLMGGHFVGYQGDEVVHFGAEFGIFSAELRELGVDRV